MTAPARILTIEDEPPIRDGIVAYLEDTVGYAAWALCRNGLTRESRDTSPTNAGTACS